jgi:predicted MFS family arabinose efflux permease
MLVAAWSTGLLATVLMALSTSITTFVIGLLLYSFTAFVSSPLNSYVTSARGKWTVARALTVSSASFNLGMIVGPLLGGWISQNYGLRSIYGIAAGIFVVSTAIVWFIPSQPRDEHPAGALPVRDLLSNRPFLQLLAMGAFAIFAMTLPQQFTPKYLQDVHQVTLEQIGLLGALGGIGTTALTFTLGGMAPRLGFLIGSISMAATTLLFWRAGTLPWFGLAYFLQGGFRAGRSLLVAQIRPLVNEANMGLAYGVTEMAWGFSTILAPIIAGLLYNQQPALMYPVAFAGILLTIWLFQAITPHKRHNP